MTENRTIAYLCPKCGQSVIVTESLFALSANTREIPCPCGKSHIKVDFAPETAELTIPCHVCKKIHRVSCPSKAFVGEDLLNFSCSGVNCCLVGEESAVFTATSRMEQEADLWQNQGEEKGAFLNEIVMEEVLSELKEIAARGGISCLCGSTKWGFQVDFTTVEVGCATCGNVSRIPATTQEDIDNICCCYELKIGGKGGTT